MVLTMSIKSGVSNFLGEYVPKPLWWRPTNQSFTWLELGRTFFSVRMNLRMPEEENLLEFGCSDQLFA